ncbi:MAG: hypothetical protein MUF07_04235 [Steroidobacteraceae bacterium]|jgi:predicted dienelactone hydrolase|nr:hypothetical protein [Steroidobacteraceae bacterium]
MRAPALASLLAMLVGACATMSPTGPAASGASAGSAPAAPAWPQPDAPIRRLDTVLVDPADRREIPLRLVYPDTGTGLPVVLFSHGAFSSGRDYDALLEAWAGRGYVVIAPTHRDSTLLGTPRGAGDARHFPWRLDDMALLLRELESVLATVPGLAARADAARIGATGHSFGGLLAQSLGGATYFDPAAARAVARADPRVRAVVVFSGAGAFPPILRAEDFLALQRPTLVTVGTDDLPQAPGLTGQAWRRQPWEYAAPGAKYLLTLEGADHYLGGMVGRDDLPRSPRGPLYVAAFQQVSSAFLDAYLRADARARSWLDAEARAAPAAGVASDATTGAPGEARVSRLQLR